MMNISIGLAPEDCEAARHALINQKEPGAFIAYDEKMPGFPWLAVEIKEGSRTIEHYQTAEGAIRALLYERR